MTAPDSIPRPSIWAWVILAVGLAWTVALRVPLVLNAVDHLDSDLAVDGLTLLDASQGHWRWHYPGTPHIGSFPILFSLPQGLLLGVDSETLVSGGVALWAFVVIATFLMARSTAAPIVAVGALLPLVFSSTGTIWLSGRITGGHLLAVAWHAGALAGLAGYIRHGGVLRAFGLGLWCGLGLWHDLLFALSLAGLLVGALLAWWSSNGRRPAFRQLAYGFVGLLVGLVPIVLGRWFDPYDAYGGQFQLDLSPARLGTNTAILLHDCLPRLLAGHRLPDAAMFLGEGASINRADELDAPWTWATMALFVISGVELAVQSIRGARPELRAICAALLVTTVLSLAAFLTNRTIANSDNYRYLVLLLPAYALGTGLFLHRITSIPRLGRVLALGLMLAMVLGSTLDAARWYARHDWIGDNLMPKHAPMPLLQTRMYAPTATHVFGDYWDVYRESFLNGGTIQGVPLPIYPNRFPGWSRSLGPDQGLVFVSSGRPDWRAFWRIAWENDGGDPNTVDQVPTAWKYDPTTYAPQFRAQP